jgi:hypothetical protein
MVTQTQIDALTTAIANGVLEVTTDTNGHRRTVKYQSTSDMLKALSMLKEELKNQQATDVMNQSSSLAMFTR